MSKTLKRLTSKEQDELDSKRLERYNRMMIRSKIQKVILNESWEELDELDSFEKI